MAKANKNFSAFKLFYDELIYKTNSYVSYAKIDRNIKIIKKLVNEIKKTPKKDEKYYNIKLDRINLRLKNQLQTIYNLNNNIFEYYYLLYKSHKEICNDKVSDIPLIISCSFYEDFKITNKNAMPVFSSLEKKEIHNNAKNLTRFEYFVQLIKEQNEPIFRKFIEKTNFIMNQKPNYEENFEDFMKRISNYLYEYRHIYIRVQRKAKLIGCYNEISEKMFIAYKKEFENWNDIIEKEIIEYFNKKYASEKEIYDNSNIFKSSNVITYEEYAQRIQELCDEKDKYIEQYEKNEFIPIASSKNNSLEKFKTNLINNYFDYRYKNNLSTLTDEHSYVDRAIELYELANDLTNQIFERITFDSSHSLDLKRNNDAGSALIIRIYDLYNPIYMDIPYEEAKNEFEELLNNHPKQFIKEYNRLLDIRKLECNYHGPIPSKEFIYAKIIEKRKKFILDYCMTELKSRDFLDNYDTRNYDLLVMSEDLNNDDLVSLYYKMKDKINKYDFNNLFFMDSDLTDNEVERQVLLSGAQELTIKSIYRNLNIDNALNSNDYISEYRDICYGYLNEQLLFMTNTFSKLESYHSYEKFLKNRNLFNNHSKWQNFLIENKIKNNTGR